MIDELERRVPEAELRPFVAWATGYRQAGVGPQRHRGLPSPWLTFIVTLDDPLVIEAHVDPRQPAGATVVRALADTDYGSRDFASGSADAG